MVATAGLAISISCLAIKQISQCGFPRGNIPVSRRIRTRVMKRKAIPKRAITRVMRVSGCGVSVQVWGMVLPTEHLGPRL